MALSCQDVAPNVQYSCSNPWGNGCINDHGFDFLSLWNITQKIQGACASDPRLFLDGVGFSSPENAAITQEACEHIAGRSWTAYSGIDIWQRLTTWKFPLLQLVFIFPRPPLDFAVETFVILHLVGDPIDTLRHLLLKLSTCQKFAEYWREYDPETSTAGFSESSDWKALALITDAFAEWEKDHLFQSILRKAFKDASNDRSRTHQLKTTILQTGQAIAADRSTKALPVFTAQVFFIATTLIAFFRTLAAAQSSDSRNEVFINVEAHSVAFTALYFWVIPTVILGSIIGVSQTRAAIPRILKRFQDELPDGIYLPMMEDLPNLEIRKYQGGMYSWQPSKHQEAWRYPFQHTMLSTRERAVYQTPDETQEQSESLLDERPEHPELRTRASHTVFGLLTVVIAAATGIVLSSQVPPKGWNCRHIAQVLILFVWLISAAFDPVLTYLFPFDERQSQDEAKKTKAWLFWTTFIKNVVAMILTTAGIIATQIGVLNRCDCYTNWARFGVTLPLMTDVARILRQRLTGSYLGITLAGIGIQLVLIPLYVCFMYSSAIRVFIQRDDGESNCPDWLWTVYNTCRHWWTQLRQKLHLAPTGPPRTNTINLESGTASNPIRQDPVLAGTPTSGINASYNQPEDVGHNPVIVNRVLPTTGDPNAGAEDGLLRRRESRRPQQIRRNHDGSPLLRYRSTN